VITPLVHFHLCGTGGSAEPQSYRPRLMPPRGALLRTEYPLLLPPGDDGVVSLTEALESWVEVLDPGGAARELRDNLERIEQAARQVLGADSGPQDARETLATATARVRETLALAGDSGDRFSQSIDQLLAAVPECAALLPYHDDAWRSLLQREANRTHWNRWLIHREKLAGLAEHLRRRIEVEHSKDPATLGADGLSQSVGDTGARLLDASRLAALVGPHRGTLRMPQDRLDRITEAVAVLDQWVCSPPSTAIYWFVGAGAEVVHETDRVQHPLRVAERRFQRAAERLAEVVRAARTAELELTDEYVPEHHGPWLDALDWQGFTREELSLLPTIVAVEGAEALADGRMVDLVRLALSGRPVQIVLTVRPSRDPGGGSEPMTAFRFDPGRLALGQREALVQQSTAARPQHLMLGLEKALAATRCAIHVMAVGPSGPTGGDEGWLAAGAAVEGRAHALFQYDPEAGASWARRMTVDGNPALEGDWPADEEGAAFTFCDYALLDPAFAADFTPVNGETPEGLLCPAATWLALDPLQRVGSIPFVDAVNPTGTPLRLAVTRRLALAAADRLSAWRSVRELAGVRNQHVLEAVEQAQEEAAQSASAERERLTVEQAAALEAVERRAATQALERLANALVSDDPSAVLRAAGAPAPVVAAPLAADAEPVPDTPVEEAPEPEAVTVVEEVSDDPWIDSPMCTTCGDCLEVNSLLFIYDGNKQAILGDMAAGSFRDLVVAAEACPAKCIHPGKPADPSEPDLDALIQRAEPFQ